MLEFLLQNTPFELPLIHRLNPTKVTWHRKTGDALLPTHVVDHDTFREYPQQEER